MPPWTNVQLSSDATIAGPGGGASGPFSVGTTSSGYVVRGGYEYMINANWMYLYYGFTGAVSATNLIFAIPSVVTANGQFQHIGCAYSDQLQVRLGYSLGTLNVNASRFCCGKSSLLKRVQRRAANCATPTGSADHAGPTANLKLTFHRPISGGYSGILRLRARIAMVASVCTRALAEQTFTA